MFITNGYSRDVEEDSYADGMLGQIECSYINYTFSGKTLIELYEALKAFLYFGDDAFYIDDIEENGKNVLRASVLENERGEMATKGEKASWKIRKKKLYSATYTFYVLETTPVDLENSDLAQIVKG